MSNEVAPDHVETEYQKTLRLRREAEEEARETLSKGRDNVMAAINGYTAMVTVKFHDLSPLQKNIVMLFARISSWTLKEGEQGCNWWKFDGFNECNKGLVRKTLRALALSARAQNSSPETVWNTKRQLESSMDKELALMILNHLDGVWPTAYATVHGILQLLASQHVEHELKKLTDSLLPNNHEPASDSVFGNHNGSSIDDVPF